MGSIIDEFVDGKDFLESIIDYRYECYLPTFVFIEHCSNGLISLLESKNNILEEVEFIDEFMRTKEDSKKVPLEIEDNPSPIYDIYLAVCFIHSLNDVEYACDILDHIFKPSTSIPRLYSYVSAIVGTTFIKGRSNMIIFDSEDNKCEM